MIRKLRFQFILIALSAVFLVLLVLVGGINLLNYREILTDSDQVLEILFQNGGSFPERRNPRDQVNYDDFFTPNGRDFSWLFSGRDRTDSPELPFETRYFSAMFRKDGSLLRTDTNRIEAIDDNAAAEYAIKAIDTGEPRGFFGDYRFYRGDFTLYIQVANGEDIVEEGSLVVFCDCGASLANFRNFLRTSIFVSLSCLILVGVLIFLLSKKILAPVAESYEKQKRFITDAGHEIKTPLAIISADVDVLEMELAEHAQNENQSNEILTPDVPEKPSNEWLSDIKTQTKRLSELTRDLILLSKMEENSTTLDMQDLDLTKLVSDEVSSFRAVAVSSDKTLTASISSDVHIHGDRKSIESLVSILLDNAVKYCPKNGKISVSLVRSRKNAFLEVTNDTQETPSPEMLKNMFERFYRSDESRNRKTGGYGIGLSIAKAVVEKHKGRITAASRAEKQLTFTVTL